MAVIVKWGAVLGVLGGGRLLPVLLGVERDEKRGVRGKKVDAGGDPEVDPIKGLRRMPGRMGLA